MLQVHHLTRENQRLTAEGLLTSFQLKQIDATACLFREIFAITGPLSRYLQSIDVDLGKATSMIDSAILQLEQLQNNEEKIVKIVENDFDEAFWKENRVRRRRVLDGEASRDEPAVKPVALWKRNTFFSTMDTVVNSTKNHFKKNQPLLKSIALFAPSQFSELQRKCKTSNELQSEILSFCQTYGIDSFRCADELFSFSRSFKKFDCSILANESLDEGNTDIEDEDEDADLYCDDVSAVDDTNTANGSDTENEKKQSLSFSDALKVLCHPDYHLVDAYPTLCYTYSIVVAIPISSATAERSFSALKRVKTRIHSSMVQERLEGLLLMAVE